MEGHFTDFVPIAKVCRGPSALVSINVGPGHEPVIVPRDVVRKFCTDTLFVLDEWEREQSCRVVAHPTRKKRS